MFFYCILFSDSDGSENDMLLVKSTSKEKTISNFDLHAKILMPTSSQELGKLIYFVRNLYILLDSITVFK